MKTLKSLVAGACLLIAFTSAKAGKISADKTASPYYAVNTYVDAMTMGKTANLDNVIDKSAQFSVLRGKKIESYGKADLMAFVKDNEDISQQCTVNTAIVSSDADVTVVKVDMQYDNLVRTNYITLTNNSGSWKITNVYSLTK